MGGDLPTGCDMEGPNVRSRSAIADCEDCLSRMRMASSGRNEVPGSDVEVVIRSEETLPFPRKGLGDG